MIYQSLSVLHKINVIANQIQSSIQLTIGEGATPAQQESGGQGTAMSARKEMAVTTCRRGQLPRCNTIKPGKNQSNIRNQGESELRIHIITRANTLNISIIMFINCYTAFLKS